MTRLRMVLILALLSASGVAYADADTNPQPTDSQAPNSLVMPKGKVLLDAFLEMNLSSGAVFKPVSLSPDIWYGVTDDLTLGLVHSTTGGSGFIGGIDNSLCFGSACEHFYPDVGLDARYRLARPLALDVGLYALDTSPFQLAIKLGIDGRWTWNKLSLEVQPSLYIGVTNRSQPTQTMGGVTTPVPGTHPNTEDVYLPITVAYLVAPRVDIALQPGLVLPFTATGSTWRVPIALAARFAATPKLGIGLAFAFLDLIGGTSTADTRSLTLGGTYAF
jgi:hypothetical protein